MEDTASSTQTSMVQALARLGDNLRQGLSKSRALGCLGPYVFAVGETLLEEGIAIDRINLPAAKYFGFRHPRHSIANLTWLRGPKVEVQYLPHTHKPGDETHFRASDDMKSSPYYTLVFENQDYARFNLKEESFESDVLQRLQNEGYVDYVGVALPLPNGAIQPLSIASKNPLPEKLFNYLDLARPILATALDSLYQGAAARSLAQSYLGRLTGPRVLAGEFSRGNTQIVNAGILFCDIRGFTAMSESLGAEGVVSVVNQVFDVIGEAVHKHGGEILKFIGDAVLIVFSHDEDGGAQTMVQSMLQTVSDAVNGVTTLAQKLKLPLAIGFGGHIGDVLYGNIGTEERLDFTVMGPSVNLASRLEGLCKKFSSDAIFSSDVAAQSESLVELGLETLKGIDAPVKVWGISS